MPLAPQPHGNEVGDALREDAARESSAPPPGNPSPADRFVRVRYDARVKRDINICYQTFGDPLNPCLLLISGLGCTLYVYDDAFCKKLADAGYHVVRFDNRDVGLSTHLDGLPTIFLPYVVLPLWLSWREGDPPYLLNCMALDALSLLAALGIRRAHVAGSSMGGMIAQCMAILQPERILSMTILYSHSGGPKVKPQTFGMTLSFLDRPASASRADVMAYKIRNAKRYAGLYTLDEERMVALTNTVLDRAGDDEKGILRQIWAIRRSPARDQDLNTIRHIPTLIIHGTHDDMIPIQNGLQLCQLIEGSKLVVFPRMGHWLPPELYDDVIEEICLLRKKGEPDASAAKSGTNP